MNKRQVALPLSPFAWALAPLEEVVPHKGASQAEIDDALLALACAKAFEGVGRTGPNPPVGAVVARGGKVVGVGYHRRAGAAHAEVAALDEAGPRKAKGATLYVTLEPCNHHGRTAPCTERILAEGVARVVVGVKDPHPLVRGRGLRRLKRAGVEVEVRRSGPAAAACRALLAPFASTHQRGRPWVVAKVAASLDGKVAAAGGHARWVTGKEARGAVHRLRDRVCAVLVGADTALHDDPALTVRHPVGRKKRHPVRVVLDGRLRVPATAQVYAGHNADRGRPFVIHGSEAPAAARAALDQAGVERVCLEGVRVSLASALAELSRRELHSVLVEPGPHLFGAVLDEGLLDEVWWMSAPTFVGDDGVPAVAARGIERMDDALDLDPWGPPLRLGRDTLQIFGPPRPR